VVGFTDSTIFSNFSAFEPGKAELMLGMIEWLNHRSPLGNPRPWLVCCGTLVLLSGWVVMRFRPGDGLLLVTSGLLGWAVAVLGVQWAHRVAMPEPKAARPLVQVVIDRTLCDGPLATNGFMEGSGQGFGIFERWLLRLGYFTVRRQGPREWDGDLVVFLHPRRTVSESFRQEIAEYVAAGGKVLIIDSPENEDSTSNDVLQPWDVSVDLSVERSGQLRTAAGWPAVTVQKAATVRGGEPFAWIGGQPVGATVRRGLGQVTVIGFGSRFADANMGGSGNVVPDEQLQPVFDLLFSLLRGIFQSEPIGAAEHELPDES
jgi:hypothetical protein